MGAGDNLKSYYSKHRAAIISVIIIGLMLFASVGYVLPYLQDNGSGNASTASTVTTTLGSYVAGVYGNITIRKGADYFALIGGNEWHFRVNPLKAANVSISDSARSSLSYLMLGNEAASIFRENRTIEKVIILLNPNSSSRVTLAATEISSALGANNWTPEVYFTEGSSARPDVRNITLQEALSAENSQVIYLDVFGNTSKFSSFGNTIVLNAVSYDELDLMATRAKMILLGWEE